MAAKSAPLEKLMIEGAIFAASATGYGFGVSFDNTVQWLELVPSISRLAVKS